MEVKGCDLSVGYADKLVIQEMNITVYTGEITTIIGPNGSGKSTVLKALTNLLPCCGGHISLDGKEICCFKNKALAKLIGVLPQQRSVPPDFKVVDLVSFGRVPYQKWYNGTSSEDKTIIDWALQATNSWNLKNKLLNECSGGELQRVWIAAVLAQQPQIMFLDEPTTFLDIAHQYDMLRLIKQLNKETGIGVVLVLHDLGHALEISDRVIVIKHGRKYSEGRPNDIITSQMMKDVYEVECEIIKVPGRDKPILNFRELN